MPPTPVKAVALIPARAGSSRVRHKNIRRLAGHPLLAYTIAAARASDIFDRGVWVSSDSEFILDIAAHYGALPIRRPSSIATSTSPDIRWVRHALDTIGRGRDGAFAILRPTSPLRTAATIRRAWAEFTDPDNTCDTLRAVEVATQHPGKMWLRVESTLPMIPVLEGELDGTPYHSCPTQALPRVYIQNASLECCYGHLVYDTDRITGRKIAPFLTWGHEGFDLNTEADWQRLVALVAADPTCLPPVPDAPYPGPDAEDGSPDPRGAVAGGSRL